MPRPRFLSSVLVVCAVIPAGSCWLIPAHAAENTPMETGEEFFEAKIRPLLLQRCGECHNAETREGNLRIDVREDVLGARAGAPIVAPGDPDKSKLIAAVRYSPEIQMPPDAKLPAEEVKLLEEWVKSGATWRDPHGAGATGGVDPKTPFAEREAAARATHWAFQPIARPAVPDVKQRDWPANEIDRFILARLETQEMTPSPAAEKRTLIRRATYDLTGLPPTIEEVEAFAADESPDAFEKVVERLLASPRYGEHWGRHWLDVARYADTKGYVFTQEPKYQFAYTYRDYVIRAFNEDKPFDQFILEQIAADQLPLGEDKTPLAAMGFLTVGRRFSNNVQDIIDDRIDTTTRGFMGLTVSCARCHDHKYDPIPTADYYSLFGVFSSSVEPEPQVIAKADKVEESQKHSAELAKRQKAYDFFIGQQHEEFARVMRTQSAAYLFKIAFDAIRAEAPKFIESADQPTPKMAELNDALVKRWGAFFDEAAKRSDPLFALWREFMGLKQAEFEEKAGEIVARLCVEPLAEADQKTNPLLRAALIKNPPKSKLDVARIYGELLTAANQSWLDAVAAHAKAPGPAPLEKLPDAAQEELRQALYAPHAVASWKREDFQKWFEGLKPDNATRVVLRKSIDEWAAKAPPELPRAMVMNDSPTPADAPILIRGTRPGEITPRRFLKVLSPAERKPFSKGSGRLELAQAIASADNPLTARVMVNRVWQHHFGHGLVRTPSDFGVRSEAPTHPELLDYLASSFIEEGWSVKALHRKIMLSRAYQQSSAARPEYEEKDAENSLVWRMNRRRLDLEPMRDSMLTAAGALDGTIGGPSVNIWSAPFSGRRSVYAFINRQDLPGVFRVFDFASPDISMGERPVTTVPQQTLFGMNAPFVQEQAKKLAERPDIQAAATPEEKIAKFYHTVLQRSPDADEVKLSLDFIRSTPEGEIPPEKWRTFAQALLVTNEFMFVD